ncbi:Gfo/Idh/MocA family oxidoreductase [Povalibacter sp.]|uniref:Gfo/Idh/MocA family oxidoreductase n=1 Tax=Povalibacter sp. TaxID=1962978 RepID=UPI002F4147B9
MTIRAGLIGFGLAGRYFHAPLLGPAGIRLHCVVTSRVQELRDTYPDALALESAQSLIARGDVDLVVIASPNQFHFPQARAALLAGKHVVVDKPMSITAAEAQTLAELARSQRRVLAAFQNRRWDSDFLTVRKLLDGNRLGQLASYRARWDRFRPQVADRWRERPDPGSGMLYDLGSHLIDQALTLFGRPDWVQADVFVQRPDGAVDDGFEILMAKGSLRISLGVSSLAGPGDFRYCIHGSDASFVKYGLDPQEDQLRSGQAALDAGFGVEAEDHWGVLISSTSSQREIVPSERGRWLRFYEAVKQSIVTGADAPVTAHDARDVIEIIEAAQISSREGRRIPLL